MAVICPFTNEKVLYLECQECEEKLCKSGTSKSDSPNVSVCQPDDGNNKRWEDDADDPIF